MHENRQPNQTNDGLRKRCDCSRRMHAAGWTLAELRDLLGHADISTTSRYLNVQKGDLRAAMQRMEAARPSTPAQILHKPPVKPSRRPLAARLAKVGKSLTH